MATRVVLTVLALVNKRLISLIGKVLVTMTKLKGSCKTYNILKSEVINRHPVLQRASLDFTSITFGADFV